MTKRSLHLRDIILLALIGIIFGVIYFAAGFVYNGLTVLLTPIRTPGAAFFGEFLGAAVEMLLGDQWGAANLISGAVQGIGSELGFTFTLYKMYNWLTLLISSLTLTFVTFGWDWFRNGYNHFSGQMLIIMLIARFISMFVFSGILVKLITNLLQRAHLIKH